MAENGFQTQEQYCAAISKIGELVLENAPESKLTRAYAKLEINENESTLFLPFKCLRMQLQLQRPEIDTIALWMYLCQHKNAGVYQTFGEYCKKRLDTSQALAILLREVEDGCYLRKPADNFLFGRAPLLPEGSRMIFSSDWQLFHSRTLFEELNTALEREHSETLVVVITGEPQCGKKYLLQCVACAQNRPIAILEPQKITADQQENLMLTLLLYQAVVCLNNFNADALLLLERLSDLLDIVFITVNIDSKVDIPSKFRVLYRRMQPLSAQERLAAMQFYFQGLPLEKQLLIDAASLYRLNIGRIKAAAGRLWGEYEISSDRTIQSDLLQTVFSEQSIAAMSNKVQKFQTNKTLKDLILPESQKRQIADLCNFIRSRSTVYQTWGFEHKISYGRGITILFYGASGTGKTMAASVIANELGFDLYRVDLSQLISKYIGETQKNIGQIFDEARQLDCILLFDEADALFSKRGEISDSHDKYSNAEISYLLQKTEEYDGVIILATNLLQNIDEAFRRRISHMVHFSVPDASSRRAIWQGAFPEEAPLDKIDFDLLSESIELTGAEIKNCTIHAAYLSAAQNCKIGKDQIIAAIRGEYAKGGKTLPVKFTQMFP